MQSTSIQREEVLLEADKKIKYRGTARIRLQWLYFQSNELRKIDIENIKRLKVNLVKDCRRINIRNHVPAIINQSDLDDAIIASGLTSATLLSDSNERDYYLELKFPAGYHL